MDAFTYLLLARVVLDFGLFACATTVVVLPIACVLAFMDLVQYQRDGGMHGTRQRSGSRSLVSNSRPDRPSLLYNAPGAGKMSVVPTAGT